MGFSTGTRRDKSNRRLQNSVGGKFTRSKFELGASGEFAEYNEAFDKELSNSKLERSREKAREEVRKDRMRSLIITLIISPIVIGLLIFVVMNYLKVLNSAYVT